MYKIKAIQNLIISQGVLPLYFNKSEELSVEIMRSLYTAGVRTLEYTNRGEEALENFRKMRTVSIKECPEMRLGVGTIRDARSARAFILEGADYLISPGLINEVAEVADEHGMLWIPGCMTPSEILTAERMGARFIKLFPGNVLGPGYMSAIRDLFPNISFMPTGGVESNPDNIKAWFSAGVSAVGLGSKLISNELMRERQYGVLADQTRAVLEMVKSVREQIDPGSKGL